MSHSKRRAKLLRATKMLLATLAPNALEIELLQASIEALSDLLQVKYGAIGVLNDQGNLTHFVHTGISAEVAGRIEHLPKGTGLLGVVIRENAVLRLDNMSDDPRSEGFPANHPPMTSLLAVPISNPDRVYGRIYLCNKLDKTSFSDEDEALAMSFANAISRILDNAREMDELQHEQSNRSHTTFPTLPTQLNEPYLASQPHVTGSFPLEPQPPPDSSPVVRPQQLPGSVLNVAHEKSLYPKISASFTQAGAVFPAFLANNFERILQRIEILWGGKEIVDFLSALFLRGIPDDKKNQSNRADQSDLTLNSNRSNRHGFPVEAVREIVLLQQVNQTLFPLLHFDPYDPFSGAELMPIEVFTRQDTHSINEPAQKVSSDTPKAQTEPPNAHGKSLTNWPIIRTQHELAENAESQHRGESIYPLQGRNIGEILIHYGVIDKHSLSVVLVIQKKPAYKNQSLGEILIGIGLIKPDELLRALLIQAGTPMIAVSSIDIPPEITKSIPHAKAREKMVVPVGNYHDTLYLAVANPFSFKDHSFFTMMTGKKIGLVFAPIIEIINLFNVYGLGKKSTGAAKEEFRKQAERVVDFPLTQSADMEIAPANVSENDSVIVNLVNQMILSAIREEASDIHIELFDDGADAGIRFRRDGNMDHFSGFPRAYHKAVVSRIKIMSSLDISEMRRPQDGKISFHIPGNGRVDLRVATIPASPGVEFVTIRILSSSEPMSLGNLGMVNRDVSVFRELFQRPYGLILVCGPTGSGKTTTLHSVLKELNTENRKIWTAEDPVEIVQPHLCQVQVNSKIGMTFDTILRALLRADPDVIMIGEMRDHETAQIALEASMTGHLVLSTLHTNSAFETVARLLDLGIDPYNLADALLAILAQRLARKLCTVCAKRELASASDLEDIADEYYFSAHAKSPGKAELNNIIQSWRDKFGVNGQIYLGHAVGCEMCTGGYKGRLGLYELLQATPSQRHLIRQRAAASDYLAMGVADGTRTLKQDGIEKVIRGLTDMMQVRGACI